MVKENIKIGFKINKCDKIDFNIFLIIIKKTLIFYIIFNPF